MKIRRTLASLLAVAALQSSVAFAQFPFDDDPPAPAWEQFTLDPKVRVKLDFRNASIDAILQMLSQASGVTIIKDPALNGGLTLQSPKQQTLADAFAQLNAVLGLKNYEIQREGNFLIIRAKQQRGGFGGRFGGGDNGNGGDAGSGFGGRFGRGSDSSETVLRVYQIKYANASQVARVLNEVFAGSGVPPVQPQNQQPQRTGQAAEPSPVQVAQRGNRGGFAGFGGGNNQRFGGRTGTISATSVVRASADDFSNSVIVNAPSREQEQVARLIEQIDKQTEQPQQSRVFNLQYASAVDLAPVVQNVLISNVPRGRGGFGATGAAPIDRRFGGGGGAAQFSAAASAIGTVVPEIRTNALVVTTTADNLTIIEKVIEELDKEVTFENSSFVVTLENARSDQIAQLLNQSFGGRVGGQGGQFLGGGARTTTVGGNRTQNRNQTQRNTTGGTRPGGGRGPNAQEMGVELQDPEAEEGELATNVTVAQNFGQFGGNRGNLGGRGQQAPPTGFDNQGRVVNVRDLSGQVVAIPDINTNSVIIVTSPENREILEQILTQLDRIPEQVMIETLIVEASLDASNKLGVEWQFGTKNVFGDKNNQGSGTVNYGLQANAAQPQGLRYTLTGSQYSVFLTALQGDSRFEVLSTPRIFTSNNATAEINISQSLPYVLSQRADVNGNLLFNYAFLDVGIILTVTPRITSNGYVTMEVVQTANDFVGYTDFNAPIVNQREAQTTVSVKDGETIVLGGIIKNTVTSRTNKLPILGDIPILGNLFKSTSKENNKTELLVFLTPRIVRDAAEANKIRENTEKLMDGRTKGRLEDYRKLLERNGIPTTPSAAPTAPPVGTQPPATVPPPATIPPPPGAVPPPAGGRP